MGCIEFSASVHIVRSQHNQRLHSLKDFHILCTVGTTLENNGMQVKTTTISETIEFFTVNTKLSEMAVLASKNLTTAKKVTTIEALPDARNYYWFKSSMLNQLSKGGICLCELSHALSILTKSSKSKNQVVHKQKFKDPLTSNRQFSSVG